jgi:tetratricopeptide (TPR) repeat protein
MKKLLQIAACSMAVFAGAWCLSQYYIKQNPLVPAPDTQDIERAQELAHRIATRHKAVKNSPKNIKLRWALAETYSKAGYVDAAATHMQIIVAQAPDFLPARLSLGNIYIAKEEWEKAEEIFRFLVKRNTNVPEVWGSLAAVLYRQAKYLPAVQAAARAVKLEPADANHRYIMGVSYLEFAMQYSDPRTQRGALQVAVGRTTATFISAWAARPVQCAIGQMPSAT